jgi:nucleotide-binding universal stress UspA family protein
MKNILVLTDFSERAKSAAEYATRLAVRIEANILLCHALEITEQLTYPLADHLVLKNQAMKRLKEVGMHLQNFVPGISGTFRPSISYINDVDMLTEVADKLVDNYSVDLVVIGTSKSQGLTRFFFGSHTNDVLDHIKCPVLLIPEKASFKPIKNIAYATDLTFDNSKVIRYLASLAKPFNSEISVNHISPLDLPLTDKEKALERSIIEQMDTIAIQLTYRTIKGDSVSKGILDLVDSQQVDLLTLVHKRYDFFEGLFHSSISKQLAQSTKVPLLVMPYIYSLDEAELVSSH